jgi:hypothetical protein
MWSRPRGFPWGRYFHEGTGGVFSEGLGLALAIEEFGNESLDAFLRYLLTHLTYFRSIVDHRGFNWSSNPNYQGTKLQFLCTICKEEDPILKKQKEEQYAKEVIEEFANFRNK